MSACLPAFRALGSAFPSSSLSLLAQVKWNVLTNIGASGYVGNARLIRAHWLSLHWVLVIQTAVCVCVCVSVSVCLFGGGEVLPFTPSYYAYYTDWLGRFCSGNRLLLFFNLRPSRSYLLPLSYWYLSISHQSTSPFLSQLSPCALHSSPEAKGEGEREREGETGQACTVDNIVYARHKVACNFCSRGDTHKDWEGRGVVVNGSKGKDRDRQEVKQN